MAKRQTKYTLVQHTGYSIGGNQQFKYGVELRLINSAPEIKAVFNVGGYLFNTYEEARKVEESENYPPEVKGIIPHVRGTFVTHKGMDEPIYIPVVKG